MIDPRAVVADDAVIGKDVTIGAFAVIGSGVSIGDGTVVQPHVVIDGNTTIGARNTICSFAVVGGDPQDKKYEPAHRDDTCLYIGDDNVIREGVTIHRGTVQDKGYTRIGNNNLLMAYVHIAHDCIIADNVVLANNASLAGHVVIEDYAFLGGYVLVSQKHRIGKHAYIGMGGMVTGNVLPFMIYAGRDCELRGVNIVGLKRRQFSATALQQLRNAADILRSDGEIHSLLAQIEALGDDDVITTLADFISETPAHSGIQR